MRELSPVGREDGRLLLVAGDGENFSVQVDENLLRTIEERALSDSNATSLSPREIQDAVRAGATVEDLAATSGVSAHLIERFAHPVLEELTHILELAKSIRVALPPDRFNEVLKKPFGELVEERLNQSGAHVLSWAAKRSENVIWLVTVEFEQVGNKSLATWTFDPKRYLLTPETSNASSLSNPNAPFDSPLGGMIKAKPEATASYPVEDEPMVTAGNLEAFRKRREQSEIVQLVPETPEPTSVSEISNEPESATEVKKGRPPMPSWDEIVRGTASDDEEAF